MLRKRKYRTINNENNDESDLFAQFNESPERLNKERGAQQNLEQISSQLISKTVDIYDGWNQNQTEEFKQKPMIKRNLLTQKTSLDSSFRVRNVVRTAQTSVSRQNRATSFKEVLKEAKIYLNITPLQYQKWPQRKKQFRQKEQIKYFQGQRDKEDKYIEGVNSLIQVKGYLLK